MARSKEGAEASIKDGQLVLEEHTTTERGRLFLGEYEGPLCFRERVSTHPNSVITRA